MSLSEWLNKGGHSQVMKNRQFLFWLVYAIDKCSLADSKTCTPLFELFDPLVCASGKKAHIDVINMSIPLVKPLPELAWKKTNIDRFIDADQEARGIAKVEPFSSLHVWLPFERDCLKRRSSPDFFFSVNKHQEIDGRNTMFYMRVATEISFYQSNIQLVNEIVTSLHLQFPPDSLRILLLTPWLYRKTEFERCSIAGMQGTFNLFSTRQILEREITEQDFNLEGARFKVLTLNQSPLDYLSDMDRLLEGVVSS